ncbi:unnamed protein product (macronuclear) [Paramecium tetraurelia]|uniref:Chromo domain-containing protein n=1 Tax=Paramecium tetraurelia TaxID=5888 RepID=A0CVY9_PARTE|nr:uncharacterized protein GSPATT00001158001 [Paramecium tetraurelia]CAK74956.1 unnamed protein product [Paramecium tetraurelia]|eukprot:XP_001442353.1 hypothetical protein (macronuclear) [Paramecium tetraurelia strain d4-2]
MQIRYPIEVIKKKIVTRIEYKIRWNTGTITYEPMTDLTPEILQIVNQWELKQNKKKKRIIVGKSNKKTQKITRKQQNNIMPLEEIPPQNQKSIPHRERIVENGVVKEARKISGKIEFQIMLKEEQELRWTNLEEVKTRIPIALCDYLLQRIKFSGK